MPDERTRERPSGPTPAPPDRHPSGWRVQPAPDGRGAPEEKRRSPFGGIGRRWVILVLVLLAVNFWISSLIPSGHERVRVPYTPTFVQEIKGGNVSEISSKGATVQGTFRHEVKYPATGDDSKTSKYFDTEVPAFANTDELSGLLQEHNVTVNAKPAEEGRSFLANLLLGFGPTLLLIGIFVWIARRAAAGGAGGGVLGSFGRSRAKRIESSQQTVTFDDVAGIDEAKAELAEIVDFLRTPDKYLKLGGRIPRGVLLAGAPRTRKTPLSPAPGREARGPLFLLFAPGVVPA